MDDNEAVQAVRGLHSQYFGTSMHEAAEVARLPELLGNSKTFVDIGSSLGQYAYYASLHIRDGDIYLVEPDPTKVTVLREQVVEWEKETRCRYHILEIALSDREEQLPFFVPKNHKSSGAFFAINDGGHEVCFVKCRRLDDVFPPGSVDFVKIDVEGAEYRTLVGARRLFTEGRGVRLLLEIAPWGDKETGRKPSDVVRLLDSYGYTPSVYEQHYLYERRESRILRKLRNAALAFVLDRPRAKRLAKKTVGATSRVPRRG